jgi:hypothetical protein
MLTQQKAICYTLYERYINMLHRNTQPDASIQSRSGL